MSYPIFSDNATTSNIIAGDPSVAKKKKYILITNGESYLGQTLATFIANELTRREGQLGKKHWRVRVLCEDKEKSKDLEKRGIEVKEVDYESQSMLREQMRDNIKTVIFNPFTKSSRLISHGNNLIDAAAHEKVKRIMMISSFGCSFYEEKETPIGQFNMLEEHLRKRFKYGAWVVFRIPFIQQYFYFWTSMIENKAVIGLPISNDNLLETVNVRDICESVCQAALSKKSVVWNQQQDMVNKDKFNNSSDSSSGNNEADEKEEIDQQKRVLLKRIYEIKSTQSENPRMIAQSLTDALQEEGFDCDVEPAVITDEQLETYLKLISKQGAVIKIEALSDSILPGVEAISSSSRTRRSSKAGGSLFPNFKSFFTGGVGTDTGGSTSDNFSSRPDQDDPNWFHCPSEFLTPFSIKLIIDHFRVARCPEVPIIPTNDFRDITGREPVELADFFMKNRRQFRPELQ